MELNLTSSWHQGYPYNDLTPVLTPGTDEHCVVGCVATAMVQIMKYWEWPNSGVGSASTSYNRRYTLNWIDEPLAMNPNIPAWWGGGWGGWGRLEWTAAGGGRLRMNGYWDGSVFSEAQGINADSRYQTALNALWNRLTIDAVRHYADLFNASYNWGIMLDVHTDQVDAGDFEAAEVSVHAGIAVHMGYGLRGSSAGMDVSGALENYFRYDTDAVYADRNVDTMMTEMQWLRPVQLCGGRPAADGGGAHCWVVRGYNKGTTPIQFSMNKGWGGLPEWYSCDEFFPDGQVHTTQIAPNSGVKFVGGASGGDGSPSVPYENVRAAVAGAADGTTLIFKAGSVNTFSGGSLVIDSAIKDLTLRGYNVTIQHE